MDDQDLKQFFLETDSLGKDLSPVIMDTVMKRSIKVRPVEMPVSLLWGIVVILLASLSYALYHLDNGFMVYFGEIKLPTFPQPNPLVISPILVISAVAIMISFWLVILIEKKLLKSRA